MTNVRCSLFFRDVKNGLHLHWIHTAFITCCFVKLCSQNLQTAKIKLLNSVSNFTNIALWYSANCHFEKARLIAIIEHAHSQVPNFSTRVNFREIVERKTKGHFNLMALCNLFCTSKVNIIYSIEEKNVNCRQNKGCNTKPTSRGPY